MRALKVIVAIFTILIGAGIILAGLALVGIGIVFVAGLGILGNVAESITDMFAQLGAMLMGIVGVIMIIGGIVCLVIGILWLVLGVKFTSRKPNKGIAITLIVFYLIGSTSIYDGIVALMSGSVTVDDGLITLCVGAFCLLMAVLLILYLVLLKKSESRGNQQQVQPTQHMQQPMQPPTGSQPQMNFDPQTGQPLK